MKLLQILERILKATSIEIYSLKKLKVKFCLILILSNVEIRKVKRPSSLIYIAKFSF